MKTSKLLLIILLSLLIFPCVSFGQSVSPAPGNNTVCPGEVIRYTVNPNPGFSGCASFTWTLTNGTFTFGQSVTSKTTTATYVDVYWNDVASAGTLKVTSTCTGGGALSVGPLSYAIRSLNGRVPANARANQTLAYCSTAPVTLAVDVMFMDNTGGATGVPQERADGYEWTLPTGWSFNGTSNTESITITPGNGCREGSVSVKAYKNCGTRKYSSSASISVDRVAVSTSLTVPSGYTGPKCGVTDLVTFTATNIPCATSYRWTATNTGWKDLNGALGPFTTATNTITLRPSGTSTDDGVISVDINLGCVVKTQTYRAAYTDPALSNPVFISSSASVLCSNGSGIVSINPVSEGSTYTWSSASAGTVYINGSIRDASNPLTTTSTSITVSVPSFTSTTSYNNQIFVIANRAVSGCKGSGTVTRNVWAGRPKAPGALNISLNPMCPGEVKVGLFSTPPQGAQTLELIKSSEAFDVADGYSGLIVEAHWPATTSFLHHQTNTCGITDRTYKLIIQDCGGGASSSKVFPNPASEEIRITMLDEEIEKENTRITLVNNKGEKISEITGNHLEYTMPVSRLPEGFYYIIIKNNGLEEHKQILIKR